jgi:hypothetical protein
VTQNKKLTVAGLGRRHCTIAKPLGNIVEMHLAPIDAVSANRKALIYDPQPAGLLRS